MKTNLLIVIIVALALSACSRYIDNTNSTATGSGTGIGSGTGGSNPSNPAPTPGQTPGTGITPTPPPTNPTIPINPTNPTNPTVPGGSTGGGGTSSGSIGAITIAYTSSAPCAPSNEVFTFTCNAVGAPAGSTYAWFFGDGNSATGNPITNTFNSSGSYTILVKVLNNGQILGTCSLAISAVGQGVTPTAQFYSQQPNPTTAPNYYTFNSTSSLLKGTINAYGWDYGDGTNGTGSFSTHTYVQTTSNQTYTVKLTIVSDAGCTATKTQTVTVAAGYTISGGFTATSTNPCAPSKEVFTFTGPTAGVPAGAIYSWDFGDGGTATGNPVTKTYTFPNSYNVNLTITLNNAQLYKVLQSITSFGQDVTPVASISVQQSNAAGTAWAFNSTSSIPHGTITSFIWDYGDGTTGANAFNIKTYTQLSVAKTYTVKLTAISNANCSNTATTTVTVPAK